MATRQQIIEKVLARLDEITVFDSHQQVPTVALVDKLLDDSTLNLLRSAPMHLLDPVKINPASSTINHVIVQGQGWGYIGMPPNFIRLYALKMIPWKRGVTEAISVDNPKYKLQSNPFTRGGLAKPVVVVKHLTEINDGWDFPDPDVPVDYDPVQVD